MTPLKQRYSELGPNIDPRKSRREINLGNGAIEAPQGITSSAKLVHDASRERYVMGGIKPDAKVISHRGKGSRLVLSADVLHVCGIERLDAKDIVKRRLRGIDQVIRSVAKFISTHDG